MKSKIAMTTAFALAAAAAEAVTVSNVTAQQRYPWNQKVDISYTLSDTVTGAISVTATDNDTGTSYTASESALSNVVATAGTHTLVWDLNAQKIQFKSTNVVFNVAFDVAAATYCVIDLSDGADATSYPVTYLSEAPDGLTNSASAYKTTKLVLKRMESDSDTYTPYYHRIYLDGTGDNNRIDITKPFYVGVFEVTQKQYELVMGSNPVSTSPKGETYGTGDANPVYYVSYKNVRGDTKGLQWPASSDVDEDSFMGKLQAKTGLKLDLPTEGQWEYACRAETYERMYAQQYYTWCFGNVVNPDANAIWYMWYNDPEGLCGTKTHEVGLLRPNDRGLYDMHGNVQEMCLDRWKIYYYNNDAKKGIVHTGQTGTDPVGPTESDYDNRVVRGGYYGSSVTNCASSARTYAGESSYGYRTGFRAAWTVTGDVSSTNGFCSASSAPVRINSLRENHNVEDVEYITFSPDWVTYPDTLENAIVVYYGSSAPTSSTDERIVCITNASGVIAWDTSKVPDGLYVLRIKWAYITDGYVLASGDELQSLNTFYKGAKENPDDQTAANGVNTVGDCDTLGIDADDANAAFLSDIATATTDGEEEVAISWDPDLNKGGTEANRIYTIYGKTELSDEEWEPFQTYHKFFKVKVEKPTGSGSEVSAVSGRPFKPTRKGAGEVVTPDAEEEEGEE